ncbi:hypothetical protein D3C86_728560 [compost metagenome]
MSGVIVLKLATAREADRAVDAETGAAHIDQAAGDGQPALANRGHLEQGCAAVFAAHQIVAVHRPGGDEADVGGAQAGIEVRAVAHRADGPRQGQITRQVEIDRPAQQDDVRRVQRQAAEAARHDLIHPDAGLTDKIGHALVGGQGVRGQLTGRPAAGDAVAVLQIGRQAAVLLLAQDDAAQAAHIVRHIARAEAHLRHIGGGQLDRQQPARGPGAARIRSHIAVEEDTVLRLEADRAAVGGDGHGLLVAGQGRGQIVDLRRGARGVQHGAGTHHDIGRSLAADGDVTALRDVAVARAIGAYGADPAPRNVDDALLAQPQGHGRIIDDDGRLVVAPLVFLATRKQGHLAAARLDAAVDPHALHRGQADRLTVVDADARALGQDQFADRAGVGYGVAIAGHPVALAEAVGRQAEAGALALDKPTVGRVFAQHVRRPQLQRVLRRGAAGDVDAVRRKAAHRGLDVQLAADVQVAARTDVVAGEAGLEEFGLQMQRLGDLDCGLEHRASANRAPGRQKQVSLKDLALGVGIGNRRDVDAVRPDLSRNDKTSLDLAITELEISSGRHDRPAIIDVIVSIIDLEPVRHRPVAGQGDRGEVDKGCARHRLARRNLVHRVAVVERQGVARLQYQIFQKLQVHWCSFARRQFIAPAQHGFADGDRTTGGRDGQRPACILARAIGADGAVQRHLTHGQARLCADRQADRAALGPYCLAVQQDGGAGRNVDQAILGHGQVPLTAFQHDGAAGQVRQITRVAARFQVHPQAAGVQRHALCDRQVGGRHTAGSARWDRRQRDRAAARSDVGIDRDGFGAHGDIAARADGQVALDLDRAGRDPQRPQAGVAQNLGRQQHRVQQVRRQHGAVLDADRAAALAEDHGVGEGRFLRGRRHIGLMQLGADVEPARQRRNVLRQVIAVQTLGEGARGRAVLDHRRNRWPLARLTLSDHDIGDNLTIEQHRGRRQRQHTRVASDRIARLPAHTARRAEQGLGIDLLEGLAPAVVIDDEGIADRQHLHAGRGLAQIIELAIRTQHPRRLDIAGGVVDRPARDVEHGPLVGHDLGAGDGDGATLGRPFADAVGGVAQMAADLDQAARRIVAIPLMTARAAGQQDQVADVDPDVVVLEPLALAVQRRVAQLERLDVHLQIVRGHVHGHVAHARDVQLGAVLNRGALHRRDGDLTALSDGLGIGLELRGSSGGDLDARHILAVGQHIAEPVDALVVQQVGNARRLGRLGQQSVALGVGRRGVAVQFRQDQGQAVVGQGDAGLGVAQVRQQVNGAARIDRGGGDGHAVLNHVTSGQSDIALGRFDHAAVDHPAGVAAGVQGDGDFLTARGRARIARRTVTRTQDEVVARRQKGLAPSRDDGAGVLDLGPHQSDEAAALDDGGRFGRGDPRARLDLHRAAGVGEGRRQDRRLPPVGAGRLGRVDAALEELDVRDIRRRGDQVTDVDLRGAAENDAVAVDDIDRAISLDAAQDLGRIGAGVGDAVQGDPVGMALLVEDQIRLAPDVEAVPGQDGLLFGLADGNRGATVGSRRLGRTIGADPQAGVQRHALGHLKPALAQTIGDVALRGERGGACGGLGVGHGLTRRGGAGEGGDGALAGAAGLGRAADLRLDGLGHGGGRIGARPAPAAEAAPVLGLGRAGDDQGAERGADQQTAAQRTRVETDHRAISRGAEAASAAVWRMREQTGRGAPAA